MRIGHIERQPDGDSFAVVQAVLGNLFEFMSGPVPEIERTRTAHLKGIAGSADVLNVQFRRAPHQMLHGGHIARRELRRAAFEKLKELPVFEQSHFDGFRHAPTPFAIRQAF